MAPPGGRGKDRKKGKVPPGDCADSSRRTHPSLDERIARLKGGLPIRAPQEESVGILNHE